MSTKRRNILKINQQSKEIRPSCRTFAQDRLKRLQTQLTLQQQQQKKPCTQHTTLPQVPLKVKIPEVKKVTKKNNEPEPDQKNGKYIISGTNSHTRENKLLTKDDKIQIQKLIGTKKLSVSNEQKNNNVKVEKSRETLSNILSNNCEKTKKCAEKRPYTSCNSLKHGFKIPKIQKTDEKSNLFNGTVKNPLESMKKDSKTEIATLISIANKLANNNCGLNKVNLGVKTEFPISMNPTEMVIDSEDNITITTNSTPLLNSNKSLITKKSPQSNKFPFVDNSFKEKIEKNVQRYSPIGTKDKISDIKRIINIANKITNPNSTDKIIKNVHSSFNILNKNIKYDNKPQSEPSTSTEIRIRNTNSTNGHHDNISKRDESLKLDNKIIKKFSVNNRLENLRQKFKQAHSNLSPDELKSLTTSRNFSESSSNIIPSCKTIINLISTTSYAKPSTSIQVEPMDLDYNFENENNSLISTNDIKESTMSDFYDTVSKNILRIGAEKNQSQLIIGNNYLYFVVDTNILLNNLAFLDDLIKLKFFKTNGTIIFVPYIVLQELDKLKMRIKDSVSTLASRAIKFINEKLESNLNNVLGQSSLESNNNLIEIESPDDKIINCCLQLKMKNINFFLLSNDINLRNKAILNNINVSTKSDLVTEIFKGDSINNI